MSTPLVLASMSPVRAALLRAAGLAVTTRAPVLDERAAEAPLLEAGLTASEIALVLAEAKAASVAQAGVLTLGCDQMLSLDGIILHKVASRDEAARRLLELSGRTHELHAAAALVRGEDTLWSHVETARVTFRRLTPAEVGRHLSDAGDAVLGSVGAYQIEGLGVRLIERVEGDLFTVQGLPLLPLLAALRQLGVIEGGA